MTRSTGGGSPAQHTTGSARAPPGPRPTQPGQARPGRGCRSGAPRPTPRGLSFGFGGSGLGPGVVRTQTRQEAEPGGLSFRARVTRGRGVRVGDTGGLGAQQRAVLCAGTFPAHLCPPGATPAHTCGADTAGPHSEGPRSRGSGPHPGPRGGSHSTPERSRLGAGFSRAGRRARDSGAPRPACGPRWGTGAAGRRHRACPGGTPRPRPGAPGGRRRGTWGGRWRPGRPHRVR